MLTKPDEKLLTALIGLGATGTLQEVIKFLDGERDKVRTEMERAKGEYLIQLQGRAQFATELLDVMRDAPVHLTKLKSAKAPA